MHKLVQNLLLAMLLLSPNIFAQTIYDSTSSSGNGTTPPQAMSSNDYKKAVTEAWQKIYTGFEQDLQQQLIAWRKNHPVGLMPNGTGGGFSATIPPPSTPTGSTPSTPPPTSVTNPSTNAPYTGFGTSQQPVQRNPIRGGTNAPGTKPQWNIRY